MTQPLLSGLAFSELDLEPALLKGVEEAGFRNCTPIQAEALPLMLAGNDVEGQAQTGTGKTAAFLLGAMHWIMGHDLPAYCEHDQPRVFIVAPTRELAVQIHKDALVLGAHTNFRIGVVFGGTGYDTQRQMLKDGLDILIGTPGRLIDYFKQGVFSLKSVQVAVIDEADRMFDLGFIRDIRYLLRRMPRADKRLNMLFSATLSYRVTELAYEHMNNPTAVNASTDKITVERVSQHLYHVSKEDKIALLIGLLRRINATRTLVFVNTKRSGEKLCDFLRANEVDADMLSGDVPQRKRLQLLERFCNGDLALLVATDVAARGLHIPDGSHVFNFDLPQDAEDYVHRIGRTARAGASGDAVSFACEEYVYSLIDIQAFIGQSIAVEPVDDGLLAEVKQPTSRTSYGARHARGRARHDTTRRRAGGPRGRHRGVQGRSGKDH